MEVLLAQRIRKRASKQAQKIGYYFISRSDKVQNEIIHQAVANIRGE